MSSKVSRLASILRQLSSLPNQKYPLSAICNFNIRTLTSWTELSSPRSALSSSYNIATRHTFRTLHAVILQRWTSSSKSQQYRISLKSSTQSRCSSGQATSSNVIDDDPSTNPLSQDHLHSKKIYVSEMFTSIQGEGPRMGVPSIFLRLGVCNLDCTWCDTKYTWLFNDHRLAKVQSRPSSSQQRVPDPTLKLYSKAEELTRMSARDILDQLFRMAKGTIKNVVITGGEPLLHSKYITQVVDKLLLNGFTVEFETNGTVSPSHIMQKEKVWFNVSPKLANSGMHKSRRINFKVLDEMNKLDSIFKFVVDNQQDIDEVKDIVKTANIAPKSVYLMPQGTTADVLNRKGPSVVDACVAHGFNYTHRLHVVLWGDVRGV